jgi:hypothetical protein
MNCEDVEVAMSVGRLSPAMEQHVAECPRCQTSARAFQAMHAPSSAADDAVLSKLQLQFPERRNRSGALRLTFAAAALLVLLGAGSLLMKNSAVPQREVSDALDLDIPYLLADSEDGFDVSDDEVSFEIGWPSPTEGDDE